MISKQFIWSTTKQLNFVQILLAFSLPSIFAFLGFRYVLPWTVSIGYPPVLMWAIIASIMLMVFIIIGIVFVKREARELNITLTERLLLKKISFKQWLISLGIMIVGLALAVSMPPIIHWTQGIPGLAIPDYMPFWLDPSINPMMVSPEILSPGYPLKGNYIFLGIMTLCLALNIGAEEIYFRAWLLPKMQRYQQGSWILNGLLFTLYHSFQLWLFPMILVVSLATALTTYLSKSILPAVTIHFIANFLAGILAIAALVFSH